MNNMAISMGKRQLVDSIWKSAGIEGLGTIFFLDGNKRVAQLMCNKIMM